MFIMLKNFYRTRLSTKAIGSFLLLKLKKKSAIIRPLVLISDYEHVAPSKHDKEYNL